MKISEMLLDECDPRRFSRGKTLAQSHANLMSTRVRYEGDYTHVNGFVVSSKGWKDAYRVTLVLDEGRSMLMDFACTCADYFQSTTPCKHCIALGLYYEQHPEKFMGYVPHRIPASSQIITAILASADVSVGQESETMVYLEPEITYGYEIWKVKFRIHSPRASYVIKDLGEFAKAWDTGARLTYGAKLSCVHAPQFFTEQGCRMADLITRMVDQRMPYSFEDYAYGGYRYRAIRELQLSNQEVIDLFDLIFEYSTVIDIRCDDYSSRAKNRLTLVKGNPRLVFRLEACPQGGCTLMCDTDAIFIDQGPRMYAIEGSQIYQCDPIFTRKAAWACKLSHSGLEEFYINEQDTPRFCAAVLPMLEEHTSIQVDPAVEDFRPKPCRLEFYFDKAGSAVRLFAQAFYGNHSINLFDSAKPAQGPTPLRDSQKENAARNLAARYFQIRRVSTNESSRLEGQIRISDHETVASLLFEGITAFSKLGDVYTTPSFDRLLSDKKPQVALGVSLTGNLINLDIQAQDIPQDELSDLLGSYRLKRTYHRLKTGEYLDISNLDLKEFDTLVRDLDISASDIQTGVAQLPAYRALYLDSVKDAQFDPGFRQYVDNFKAIDPRAYVLPPSLSGVLRPYQVEGFTWLNTIADMGFGGVLADEMGLGKSLQVIALLLSRIDQLREGPKGHPALVVCPASLTYNWRSEIEKFAPQLQAQVVVGSKSQRSVLRSAPHVDVFITSYDLMRIDVEQWASMPLWCVILDEAQYIKNHGTLTAKAAKKLCPKHAFALTGTPMENRLSEIWSIFDFLMPGLLGSYARFKEEFELDILGGDSDRARRLKALIGPFMLRRLKKDVLVDLPEKMEFTVAVSMTGKQEALYAAREQNLRQALTTQKSKGKKGPGDLDPNLTADAGQSARGDDGTRGFAGNQRITVEVLAELTRLRQLCCDPRLVYEDFPHPGSKQEAIMDLIFQAMNEDKKVLVFSAFTSYLSLLGGRLEELGVPYYEITGAANKRRRLELVDAFNADSTPVFLISLKAGGTGLNLTGASVVIHADPWWNLASQNQATDRAHRIGQQQTVNVYNVVAAHSIEERILRLQKDKHDLADTVISAQGSMISTMTKEDLVCLLEG